MVINNFYITSLRGKKNTYRELALTLFRIGFFATAHGCGEALPKICHTYPTMMKLCTVIPYLRKMQKIYESRDTPLEFC